MLLRCAEVRNGRASAARVVVKMSAIARLYTSAGLSDEYVPDPEERRQQINVHPRLVDKETGDLLDDLPVFSSAEAWDGELCPHELAWLEDPKNYSREISFDVQPLA